MPRCLQILILHSWAAGCFSLCARAQDAALMQPSAAAWNAYVAELQIYQERLRIYHQELAAWKQAAAVQSWRQPLIVLSGSSAACSRLLPPQVQYAVNAANHLQESPYVLGGGHHRLEDGAYDCSSATSYVLIKAGLLDRPLNSTRFASYGDPGEGRFITIWVKPGHHVFMTLCGLRLDTSGGQAAEGPRWRTQPRHYTGFSPRHPRGF